MRVDRVVSANFRNLASGAIDFAPGLNVFIGENGQGKTNLLEAIYLFRFGRSFRAQQETELIRFGESFCHVEAACRFADGRSETFAFAVQRDGTKTIKADGRLLPRRSDLAGRFPCVLFGPGDLRIVSGEPEHRRRFFDLVGAMTDGNYLRATKEYRRVLEQRNAALKARADAGEMRAWNERLVATGVELVVRRRDIVSAIEREAVVQARDIESPFDFSMRYETSLLAGISGTSSEPGEERLAEAFAERLRALAGEEARRGVTLVGPHRDDVAIHIDGTDIRRFGSQGQRRLFTVLLKIAELSHIETALREPCVLLLDDVYSEFDRPRIEELQRLLDGSRQALVTSPVPLDELPPFARFHRVSTGRVTALDR